MRIAPVSLRASTEILGVDVESPDESDVAVYDENLPVVAEVDAGVKERNLEQKEYFYPSSDFAEIFKETLFDHLHTDSIEEHPHLNTCGSTIGRRSMISRPSWSPQRI